MKGIKYHSTKWGHSILSNHCILLIKEICFLWVGLFFIDCQLLSRCATILKCMLTALQKRFDEDMVIAGQHAFLMLLERIEALTQMHQVCLRGQRVTLLFLNTTRKLISWSF